MEGMPKGALVLVEADSELSDDLKLQQIRCQEGAFDDFLGYLSAGDPGKVRCLGNRAPLYMWLAQEWGNGTSVSAAWCSDHWTTTSCEQ